MVSRLEVNLVEKFGPLELVQKFINRWDWVAIPDSDLAQCLIVDTVALGPILILYQCNQAPTQ